MATTTEYLNQLENDKQALVNNLNTKGVTASSNETFTQLVPKVLDIQSGGGSDFEINNASYLFYVGARLDIIDELIERCKNITTMTAMFYGCKNLTSSILQRNIQKLDTSQVTMMSSVFYNCSSLTSLDLSDFNTSNVTTSMNNMFGGCTKLVTLNLNNWDTSKVTNMEDMFETCRALKTISGINNFDMSSVSKTNNMFNYCVSLTELNLSNWKNNSIQYMHSMFQNCTSLNTLDLSNLDTSKVTGANNMFTSCTKLANLKIRLNVNTILSQCPLTEESVNWILNNINTVTTARTLTLGATNLAKATPEALAVAQSRGWTVN